MTKIIEAQAIISAKDNTGGAFAAVSKKLTDISRAGKVVGESMSGMGRQIGLMQDKLAKIQNFRAMHTGLVEARTKFRDAQREVERLGRAVGEAAKPSRDLARAYEQAQRAVKGASQAFKQQAEAVSAAKRELGSAGVPINRLASAQDHLRKSIDSANASLARQASYRRLIQASPDVRSPVATRAGVGSGAGDLVGGVAGVVGAGKLGQVAGRAVEGWTTMDEALRRQQAIMSISPETQGPLKAQAFRIGQDTRFTNPDVVRAQTTISTRLPKEAQTVGVVSGITEAARDYALAMGTTMDEGAEAIIARMLARRMDMSTPEAAGASARHAANRLVQRAKISGAKHDDLMGSTKFGAAPGQVAGFSEEFQDAFEAQLQRIGYEGSMTGNFARAAAMKLSTPTTKGLAAIAASGLRYDDYVKPGTNFSAGGLSDMLKLKFGRAISGDQISKLNEIFDDETVTGDRGEFVSRVSGVLGESFARKTKSGKVNAQDAERIAKTADQFYTLNAQGVQSERLMADLVKQGLSPAVARYLFGQEHGGRAQSLNYEQLLRDQQTMKDTPGNRAAKIGEDINAGAYGAYQRMIGSIETFTTRLGEANDRIMTVGFDKLGNAIDAISNLPNPIVAFGTAVTAATGGLVALAGASRIAAFAGIPGAATVGAAAGGILAFGGRVVGALVPPLGAAATGYYLGNKAGEGLSVVGEAAAGKHWTPKGDAERADLKERAAKLEMMIKNTEERSKLPDVAAVVTGPMRSALQDIRNRLNSEVKVQGTAEVKVTIEPSGALSDLLKRAESAGKMAISNGPGSNGTTMPEAAPPRRGRGDL